MISPDSFNRAAEYIKSNARALDRAKYEYELGSGSETQVIEALMVYQNEDGGFGQAIEPDIRSPLSSIIATTVGLQYITDLDLDPSHPMIRKAVDYMLSQVTITEDMIYFAPLSPQVLESPAAPWWHGGLTNRPEFEDWANPNAEILGYLNKYRPHHHLTRRLNKFCDHYLSRLVDTEQFSYYAYLNWKRAMPSLPPKLKEKLFTKISELFKSQDLLNPTSLGHFKPQWLVTEASSFLFLSYPDRIKALLKIELDKQHDDGGWYPQWKWGPDDLWQQVKMEWSGKITLDMLTTLKYCNLIKK